MGLDYVAGAKADQIIELLSRQNELLETLLAKSFPELVKGKKD